jgi:hypothetical protein
VVLRLLRVWVQVERVKPLTVKGGFLTQAQQLQKFYEFIVRERLKSSGSLGMAAAASVT